MSDENKTLGHDYDGIQECDNDLPRWWLNIFYVSMIFAVGYMYYYHLDSNGGKSQTEIFETAEREKQILSKAKKDEVKFEESAIAGILNDDKSKQAGAQVFGARCVSCHGLRGEGGIGPNLTDDYWLHGGKLSEVATTIYKGVPEKGMVSWAPLLSKEEIEHLAVYIRSLRGTKPLNGKSPQGDLVKLD